MTTKSALRAALLLFLSAAPLLAGFAGTDVFLPSVAATPGTGGSVWYTTMWVYNPGSSPANITVYLLERDVANLAPLTYTDTIQGGDTRKYDNAVWLLFAKQKAGALRVTSSSRVVVSSRIFSQAGEEKDSVGQFFAGTPASFAIGGGKSTELLAVRQLEPAPGSTFRYNFGFVEVTGAGTCTVTVTVKDETGATLGSKSYTVLQWEQLQKSFATEFPSLSTQNARLTVEATGGSGKVIAFGSSIANGSQDPSTVEMVFRDELLAENNPSSTLTGVTAGAGLTGGGTAGNVTVAVDNGGINSAMIADGAVAEADVAFNYAGSTSKGGPATDLACTGCVTPGKISGASATSGQVLKYNGSSVTWADNPGLSLVWAGSVTTSDPAFAVNNLGSGFAVAGYSKSGSGVFGNSTSGRGVEGVSTANIGVFATGPADGVYATSVNGVGVYGSSGTQQGVSGTSNSGQGVYGTSSSGDGVYGHSVTAYGVHGDSPSKGVYGYSSAGVGVIGETSTGWAVYGKSANNAVAVFGESKGGDAVHGDSYTGPGVSGISSYGVGVDGSSLESIGVNGFSLKVEGVHGESTVSDGVVGISSTASRSGVYAVNTNASGYAGYFRGRVYVNGTLAKAAGSFQIDHPLDPANKYLFHSFVESPDMKNIYDGTVTTDASGQAVVSLPDWFEALNSDFRYQLTVIGGGAWAQARIARKIENNAFVIETSLPGTEVSWQVTGIRHDAYAEAHRIPVEEDKPAAERGFYLHPELFGQGEEQGVDWALRPELMQRMRTAREQQTNPPEGAGKPRRVAPASTP